METHLLNSVVCYKLGFNNSLEVWKLFFGFPIAGITRCFNTSLDVRKK
ncbi:hypothetical protein TM_1412 [Thermotoga maritima MSB8]|uniref:Uncharacterized protein n=1 Tax=Thermotoga maritima (strain ATCC 43589 / DSM 3109 / JCM 10099 / NBRC 100826 / MSB8) TaxID=243274 RepID=Q9X1D2_THEMA|nr:hypothetical protein TM_1412 [Thermotoga maritima MSB8]